jgi:hypothetical protein
MSVKSFITLAPEHFDDGQLSPMGGQLYQVSKKTLDKRMEGTDKCNQFIL